MPNIELSQPTPHYTADNDYAHVQFGWRIAGSIVWHYEDYSPRQAQLSARAPADVLALAPGYWGDAEVRADVLAWIAAQYGFTDATFLAPGAS